MSKTYKILEAFTTSKKGDSSTNEDGFFIDENFIAVVDGVTSKTNVLHDQKTGGQIAKDIIISTISNMSGDESFPEVISTIQRTLIEKAPFEKFGKISASAVIFSPQNMEIWSIGDCKIVIDGIEKTEKKIIDRILSELRAFVISSELNKGMSLDEIRKHDIGREMILPFLKMQLDFENSTDKFGYCVFNNVSDPEIISSMAKRFNVENSKQIILASDGYPVIKEDLESSERILHEILNADPLCFNIFPSTKGVTSDQISFDDRTYVSFCLE